jgi:hypothetical protein
MSQIYDMMHNTAPKPPPFGCSFTVDIASYEVQFLA